MRRSLTSTFYLLAILLFPLSAHATNALNYTGSANEYVATNLQSGTIGSTFTVEAWVNPSKTDDNAVISTLVGSGMELHLFKDGALCLTLKGNSGWNDFLSPTGLIALNTWSHVAASFDGTTVKLYVNGVSATVTGSMAGSMYDAGSDKLTLGRRTANLGKASPTQQLYGSLAEVQVWNVVRSATEIKKDMDGYTAAPANLLAYYKLNQGKAGGDNTASTIVTDNVGNYTGTLTSFARTGASSNWVYWKHVAVQPTGDGVATPYQIDSLPNLDWVAHHSETWKLKFQQTKDIDASVTSYWDDGAGFLPIGGDNTFFTGSYDGQDHTIAGLFINRPSQTYVGLFGYVGLRGVISNLGLTGNNVNGGGGATVGGFAGSNEGTISASYTTGPVTGGKNSNVGGFVGKNFGTVNVSYTTGSATGGVSAYVGGFAGSNSGKVSACYATGSATCDFGGWVGGFIGQNGGTVSTSYAAGSATGGSGADIGGFIGYDYNTLSKCYWNSSNSVKTGVGRGSSDPTIGKSSAEMKVWSTFTDWPFVGHTAAGTLDTWDIDANKNNGYPFLTWQYQKPRLTVTAPVVSKVYDGTTNVASNQLTLGTLGGAGSDKVILSGVATYATKNVGTGILVTVTYSLSGADAIKYRAPLPFTGNIGTITEATLTITAKDTVITLGDATPTTYRATYSGFVPNETEALVMNLKFTCKPGTAVGKYDIEPYGATAANYRITYVKGSLIINPLSVAPKGTGVEGDPYLIDSLPNLYWLSQTSSVWGKKFQQTHDIDASSTVNWDGGKGFSPIGDRNIALFTGSYDGQGHTIAGIFINRPSLKNVGLFGYIDEYGKITNLGLTNNTVTGGFNSRVGGLVGFNLGTISTCYTTGSANSGGQSYVGGLVGSNGGTIDSSYATGSALGENYAMVGSFVGENRKIVRVSYATGSATGGGAAYVGGFSGTSNGTIFASYASGSVTGGVDAEVGGFIGHNLGTISESYARGTENVGSGVVIGGFAGSITGSLGKFSRCYWNTTTSGYTAVGLGDDVGISGISADEMKLWSTFTDWTFVGHATAGTLDTWDIDANKNGGYPFLKWQYTRLTVTDPVVSKVYDGTTSVASDKLTLGTLSGFGSDNVILSGVATYATKDVGTGISVTVTYSLSGVDADKYMAPLPFTGNIGAITEAPLTITAKDTVITLGDAAPTTYSATYSGFVSNETDALVTNLQFTCKPGVAVGKYDIEPYGANAANYSITYEKGSLIINPVPAKPKGSGIDGDPYLIDSLPNLNWLSQTRSEWGAKFKQTKNIDASSTVDWDGGLGFSPIGNETIRFSGSYDGQGHTIEGLFINRPSLTVVGLFGYVDKSGVITRLGLTGNIVTGGASGYVGGLVAVSVGSVSASYATGSVTGGTGGYVGGFMGGNAGTVSESYASGSATAGNATSVGGFIGLNIGVVSASYATGSATGGDGASVGGFVGGNAGAVRESYASGSTTGGINAMVGSFIGNNEALLSKCYWNATTSIQDGIGKGSTVGVEGISTKLMQDWKTFTAWPFVGHTTAGILDTWDIDANKNNGYPFLAWQYPRLTVTDPVISSKVYDGTTSVASDKLTLGTLSGAESDDVSLNASATYAIKDVGTGISVAVTYSLSGADAGKYRAPLPFTGNIGAITEAALTIKAKDTVITLGDAAPTTYRATYSGFVPNETEALVMNLQFKCDPAATVGKYDIEPYGATAANYSITYEKGSLIINPVPVQPNGTGVEGDPYLIASLPNLYWLSQTSSVWGAKLQQTNDIDASSTVDWDGGKGFSPIGDRKTKFTGSYDGQGHTIAGLFIKRTNVDDMNTGFFGDVDERGVITNLGLIGNTVIGAKGANVGGFVGYNGGTISASFVNGSTTGGVESYVGGFVGANGGTVSTSYATNSVTGGDDAYVGGFAGNNGGTVTASYATGTVAGGVGEGSCVGGFIGYSEGGTTRTSYAIGSATGGASAHVGGFMGANIYSFLSEYYWNKTSSSQVGVGFSAASGNGAEGKSTEEMKSWRTYRNWSFVGHTTAGTLDTWDIDGSKNGGYPFLKWQYTRLGISTDPVVSKVYDGTLNATSEHIKIGALIGAEDGALKLRATATYTSKNVGTKIPVTVTYAISGADTTKFVAPLPFTGEVGTITKAPLTITADDIKLNLGAKLPTTYKFTFSEFVNSEDESVLQDLDASLSCGTCKTAGVYKIEPTATATNYELSFVNGKFTLNATSNVINRKVPVVNLEKLRHFDLRGRMVTSENP